MSDAADEVHAAFLRGTAWSTPPAGTVEALHRALASARERWPQLDVPAVDFAQAVGAAVADEDEPAAAIAALHVADLWVAAACALGHRDALDEVDRRLQRLRPTMARMGAGPDMVEDLMQQIRTRLFAAADDRPARICGYRGRGDLRSWLKVVVVRDGMRAVRREAKAPAASNEIDVLMDPAGDPELAAMHETYRESFRQVFARALAELSPRDRNVLRYHLVDGLAIDELGAIYRVHRSTAARWLVRVRERLYNATRRGLMNELSLSPSEFESVIRLIRSKLDASIAQGLRVEPPGDAEPAVD